MTEPDDRLAEIYRQYIDPGEYGYEVATCDLEWLMDTTREALRERDAARVEVERLRSEKCLLMEALESLLDICQQGAGSEVLWPACDRGWKTLRSVGWPKKENGQ